MLANKLFEQDKWISNKKVLLVDVGHSYGGEQHQNIAKLRSKLWLSLTEVG